MPSLTSTCPAAEIGHHSYALTLAAQSAGKPKGERTRAQIKKATSALLETTPPQDLTIAAICKRTGIAHGTFYIYFSDRNILLADLLLGFVGYVQATMRRASQTQSENTTRASTEAYGLLFDQNRGLMRCLVHHLDSFPEARKAFHELNRSWLDTVITSARRRLIQQGRGDAISDDELKRRAYALGGMVDQYFSSLLLSQEPVLKAVSHDRAAVIATLSLIWERGLEP